MRATQALILAAGLGLRLETLTSQQPKCLLRVGGRPLIEPMLDALADAGLKEAVFVIGFCGEKIRRTFGARYREMAITYVATPDYATSNNIVSLWQARAAIRPPFLLVESDLVVGPSLIDAVMLPDCMAVSRYLPTMRGTGAQIDDNGNVSTLAHAAHNRIDRKTLKKTVNICAISEPLWHCSLLPAVSARIDSGGSGDFYEAAFADEVAAGRAVFRAVDVSAEPWFEIDTAEDLAAAEAWVAMASPARREA